MMSLVLQRLEKLQADLVLVDPTRETNAADTVADMATALRDMLAEAGLAQMPASTEPLSIPLRVAG